MRRLREISLARIGPYAALVLLGFAIVLAIRTAHPGPRVGSHARLIDLIAREDDRAHDLRAELDGLQRELDRLNARGSGSDLVALQARADALGRFAGIAPVAGDGVVVELRDSTMRRSPTGDPNDLVIHEGDLQSVVNGLWSAGAEAIAINGERLIESSAVRCVGNTLLLNGAVYAPPYRVSAIGAPDIVVRRFDLDPGVRRLRAVADTFKLGFDVKRARDLLLPGFRGIVSAAEARA